LALLCSTDLVPAVQRVPPSSRVVNAGEAASRCVLRTNRGQTIKGRFSIF
jgi:hypothetical protein